MRFTLITVAALWAVAVAVAQGIRVPTEQDVMAKTMSADSPWYYGPLLARYMSGDATLTDDDYYYLYYGYAYEAGYDAHAAMPGEAAMREILTETDTPTLDQAMAIIEAGRQNMMVDPFSPGNINMMTWAYGVVGDTVNVRLSAARFSGITRAIMRSGTGTREKSPWHILRHTHANDIVAAMGFSIVNRQVRTREVEYIQVDRNPVGVKGYYFDFSRVYWRPFEGERPQRQRRWMFNGTPI